MAILDRTNEARAVLLSGQAAVGRKLHSKRGQGCTPNGSRVAPIVPLALAAAAAAHCVTVLPPPPAVLEWAGVEWAGAGLG